MTVAIDSFEDCPETTGLLSLFYLPSFVQSTGMCFIESLSNELWLGILFDWPQFLIRQTILRGVLFLIGGKTRNGVVLAIFA